MPSTGSHGDWFEAVNVFRLRRMEPDLHVDTAGMQAMAARWGASVGDLHEATAPTGLGLSCQTSAAAVDAAHAEVETFTAGLATQVGERATGVVHAGTSYIAQESESTAALAAVYRPTISE